MRATTTTKADMVRRHRWTQLYPEIGQGPIPTEPYVSDEIHQREINLIFKRSWLKVARARGEGRLGPYVRAYRPGGRAAAAMRTSLGARLLWARFGAAQARSEG